VERRTARLLDTHYFHVVFTLPAELRPLAKRHRERVYEILLRAAGATLVEIGADPKRLGAELGVTAVLHTWDRKLGFHPHVHCIVTGGGVALDGRSWVGTRRRYLFPVAVLAALFRGKVLGELERAELGGELVNRARRKKWHVYAKRPFGGPEQVIRYLGRYTHRVGISNARLLSFDGMEVIFRTKNGDTECMGSEEFLARFVEHVLGRGVVKIRHYGLLSPSHVGTRLERARCLLGMRRPCAGSPSEASASSERESTWVEVFERVTGAEARQCPACRNATLVRVPLVRPDARAPPN
jgi:hypothetical protein